MDLTISLALLSGLIGSLIGAILAPWINHKLELKRIQNKIFLENKLRYLEKLISVVQEENDLILSLQIERFSQNKNSKENLKKILEKMKRETSKFEMPKAYDLYLNDYDFEWLIKGWNLERNDLILDIEKAVESNQVDTVTEKISKYSTRLYEINSFIRRYLGLKRKSITNYKQNKKEYR